MEPVLNEAAKDSGRPGNKAIVRGEGFCLHRAMNKFRPLLAEFIGTFALIFVGIDTRDVIVNGTPQLATNLTPLQGILVEAILTFFLVFVVYGTAVDQRGGRVAGLAIGATITLDILFGGPLTGAAMNPARVFGPAVAANFWHDHYVYWVGPFVGGGLGGFVYRIFIERKPADRIETITVE